MKRTQLYLQRDIWRLLRALAREQSTSISELVRQAVREKYVSSPSRRREAMQAVIGLWKDRDDLPDSTIYVRRLRKGSRLKRFSL
jgi:hypothetical protein